MVLLNPDARLGSTARALVAGLADRPEWSPIVPSEGNPANFPEIIRRFQTKIDCVVIGSGDGTISTNIDVLRETGLPLGILPLGTANNLARNLGISTDAQEAAEVILTGKVVEIDLGQVNGRLFVNVAGLGLSTEINKKVPAALKRKWGVLGYAIYAFKVMRQAKPFSVTIECDGVTCHARSAQISVCNGRFYGAGMQVKHDAMIDDSKLDLSSTEVRNWWHGLFLLPAFFKGRAKPGIRILQGRHIRITTRRVMDIDTDGEVTTRTPAEFSIAAKALKVLAPQSL